MILSPPFLFDPTRDLPLTLNRDEDIWTLPTSSLWHFLKLYVQLSDPMETIKMKRTTEDWAKTISEHFDRRKELKTSDRYSLYS